MLPHILIFVNIDDKMKTMHERNLDEIEAGERRRCKGEWRGEENWEEDVRGGEGMVTRLGEEEEEKVRRVIHLSCFQNFYVIYTTSMPTSPDLILLRFLDVTLPLPKQLIHTH